MLERAGKQILSKISKAIPSLGGGSEEVANLEKSITVGKILFGLTGSDSWRFLQDEILIPAFVRYKQANYHGKTPEEKEEGRIGMKIFDEDIDRKITELIDRGIKAATTLNKLKEKRG